MESETARLLEHEEEPNSRAKSQNLQSDIPTPFHLDNCVALYSHFIIFLQYLTEVQGSQPFPRRSLLEVLILNCFIKARKWEIYMSWGERIIAAERADELPSTTPEWEVYISMESQQSLQFGGRAQQIHKGPDYCVLM